MNKWEKEGQNTWNRCTSTTFFFIIIFYYKRYNFFAIKI